MSTQAFSWTALDTKAVDTARALAMDAVQQVGNGHPGTAMSLAPAAYLLFQRHLRHDPTDPQWIGRDRFVLSCGHSSLTLYIQLYLSGYELELDDLRQLRTWGSLTPGHPEHGHTPGVETTTGPLGQGVANAVGMAMAARRTRGLLDPESPAEESIFDHTIWCIASDGDLEEGVSAEASSLAGTQQLGNLILLWDDNHISIEDDTNIAFTEDVAARYQSYGWHVQRVDWLDADGSYHENVAALSAALDAARAVTDRPSFIALRTVIGFPAPTLQGTGKSHGSALGPDEVAATKTLMGLDPEKSFAVDPEVLAHARGVIARGRDAKGAWIRRFDRWRAQNPARAVLLDRLSTRTLPAGWDDALPSFPADTTGMATRKASGTVLTALAPELPELWGGSADLAESNNTTPASEPSFLPENRQTAAFSGNPYGRVLHFGIREHAMGAILNGIALHGGTRPYGGTFLVFSDYMRPAVRLAALMKLPVTYVWTHDSIGLGEDGPTHQPIEHLAALRAIPGLDVVRPADANETAVAWRTILTNTDRPAGLALTRQNVPTWDRTVHGSADGTAHGGYILADDENGEPDIIIIATGSEVQLAMNARDELHREGISTRVVSMPCIEWFLEQDLAYREQVLPAAVTARVSVEAGIATPWREFIGDTGVIISLEHFGASASGPELFERFGFTADRVARAARQTFTRSSKAEPVSATAAS
ncbi:transketolase [Rhodococcus opacus RKJ300 = JCM 13270]|uniref:Transketolase n=1 Tax=Rhodococcus opacus RKJ300 = JCM 13270 TaxID=1165867 RepID=I0WNN1_RHOOP|nr:transketolase [Rhodococcus opacus]EID77997.1 transketolase [Rhodococcus opacus RKJ300 = JCM 13270]